MSDDATPDPLALALSTQALLMAVLDQPAHAQVLVQRISDSFGGDGVFTAMLCWTDTFFGLAGRPEPGEAMGLSFCEVETENETGADEVPPPVAWAGRFMAARAMDDRDQAQALLDSLPDDQLVNGDVVWALLNSCALNLRVLAGQL